MSVEYFDENDERSSIPKKEGKNKSKTPILDNFSRDFTDLAAQGKIDPVFGREKEVKRISQILSRKKKNNAVIVGEAGVGKTALVEKLALMVYEGKCPSNLLDKRIVALDLTSLVAGTKYRGQFEERMKAIIDELTEVDDVVIFIDELHTMVGSGNSSGGMDTANILKPALARGEIQCIGATTFDEFKKHIEKDKALSRRFLKVKVNEPSAEETKVILKNIRKAYEDYHHVTYNDEVIDHIVKLSKRYLTDKYFPDKAIDVLDELGSEKRISLTIPKEIEDMKMKIEEVKKQKQEVVRSQNYEDAARLRDQEKKLKEQLDKTKEEWLFKVQNDTINITVDDIYNIISEMTGVPITKLDAKETDKLLELENIISKSVIGQDKPIESIARAIRRNRVDIKETGKPIGSFIFLGSTGVGKTYLAKTIAQTIFGDPNRLIRFDMSEYMERHTVSKLIGAPPGYVGYDEGGTLTEKIKQNPFSVILFDEIEKAHKDIFNALLQILDDGRLTDSFGSTVDFTNTIIIMTSNIGAKQVSEFGGGIGFETSRSDDEREEHKRMIVQKELKKHFNPEFLNRIDEVITFNKLSDDHVKVIIDLELNKMEVRLEEKGYLVKIDQSVNNRIFELNSEQEYGARPIKRLIQKYCEDFLSEEILRRNLELNKKTVLKYSKENFKLISK